MYKAVHVFHPSELMFELRNIQHGERPVTGKNHRENIKQFLEKHVVPIPGDGKTILENAESSERHRPESIVVEVVIFLNRF